MRFTRRPRCDYTVTDRRRAAALRLHRRQRDSLPLLAPLIAETEPSIDEVMNARVSNWIVTTQEERVRWATSWRRAQPALEAHEPALRRALLTYWNSHRWLPGHPSYLLDMLQGYERRAAWTSMRVRFGQLASSFPSAKPSTFCEPYS